LSECISFAVAVTASFQHISVLLRFCTCPVTSVCAIFVVEDLFRDIKYVNHIGVTLWVDAAQQF